MFDVGFSELVLIALVALIVLGPKRLPEVARGFGRGLGKLRRFIADVRQDFDKELHSEELSELRKLKEELSDTRRAIEDPSHQLYQEVTQNTSATTPATPQSTQKSKSAQIANDNGKTAKKASRKNARAGRTSKH